MGVISGVVPGQILYAANLNNNYANCVNIAGDSIQGNLYLNTLFANSQIFINNVEILSGLKQAQANANAAFVAANNAGGGGGGGGTGFGNSNISSITFVGTNLTINSNAVQTITTNSTLVFTANAGSTSVAGVLQLNDTLTSTSTTQAATPNIANTIWNLTKYSSSLANTVNAYNYRVTVNTAQPGITVNGGVDTGTVQGNVLITVASNSATVSQVGVVQLNDTTQSQSIVLAATANSVNTVWAYAQSAYKQANTGISNNAPNITGPLTVTGNIICTNIIVTSSVNSAVALLTPINSSATYILSNRDNGQTITFSNSSQTLVNVNNTLAVGFRCVLTQIGTGNVIIQAGANVTINPVTGINKQIAAQYGSVTLFCYQANNFILDGFLM